MSKLPCVLTARTASCNISKIVNMKTKMKTKAMSMDMIFNLYWI